LTIELNQRNPELKKITLSRIFTGITGMLFFGSVLGNYSYKGLLYVSTWGSIHEKLWAILFGLLFLFQIMTHFIKEFRWMIISISTIVAFTVGVKLLMYVTHVILRINPLPGNLIMLTCLLVLSVSSTLSLINLANNAERKVYILTFFLALFSYALHFWINIQGLWIPRG
jgi:hypothetical protein